MPIMWPSSLPTGFLVGTDQQRYEDNALRTTMDAGPPKIRRRTTAGMGSIEGTMHFTAEQRTVFEQFWRNTLRSGTLPFEIQGNFFLFSEPPAFTTIPMALGLTYRFSLKLDILP